MSAITIDGVSYPAEPVAGGAAYELFSEVPAPGFLRLTHPGRFPYHRFVPSEARSGESVLRVPVRRDMSWESLHRLSWARLRLCRPDPVSVAAMGAQCYERGVYEVWAPLPELAEGHDVSVSYRL